MPWKSPASDDEKSLVSPAFATGGLDEVFTPSNDQLLTPPLSTGEKSLPDRFQYYSKHLNKHNFNYMLTNCAVNLIKILYRDRQMPALHRFVVEILRRSKTLTMLLQLACYYLATLVNPNARIALVKDEKKLFLGMLIIASKFNQDHNLSLKSWLKICGTKCDEASVQGLRYIERECLELLNYSCSLNGLQYENWCNILAIFGYDFVSRHCVTEDANLILWEPAGAKRCNSLLAKWRTFFEGFQRLSLSSASLNFDAYFSLQMGRKIVIDESDNCRSRNWEERNDRPVKRIRLQ